METLEILRMRDALMERGPQPHCDRCGAGLRYAFETTKGTFGGDCLSRMLGRPVKPPETVRRKVMKALKAKWEFGRKIVRIELIPAGYTDFGGVGVMYERDRSKYPVAQLEARVLANKHDMQSLYLFLAGLAESLGIDFIPPPEPVP